MATEQTTDEFVDFEQFHSSLKGVNLLRPKGSIVRVSGLTVESNGPAVGLGGLCRIDLCNERSVLAEVIGFKTGHLLLLPLENIDGICTGDRVTALEKPRYISLDDSILGRVLDGLGRPIDGKGALSGPN